MSDKPSSGQFNGTSGTKNSVRDKLLNSVKNDKLKNTVNEIYRPNAIVGDGGLADAIRHELKTGDLTKGKSHIQKGKERIKNLENILKNQKLNETDRKTAERLLEDLKDALEGK